MFSKATEYAIRATIYIAQKGNIDNKIGINEISTSIDSPQHFTAKILQILSKKNQIISSTRGPNGGFYMSSKALKLPVRAILKAMNEDTVLEKCVIGLNKCSEIKPCPLHKQYKLIKLQLIQLFENKSIEELAEEMKDGKLYITNKK
ncbi:MAG: Rrf2 family transcriptional regulator [Bacteroidetes bacterium]|jgi:Rrf2 family iron-sulfur cluster assembly transcriptional regulator|nr:Rrf2 family transcriptional regulator [Bacteroidota bacterium]MBK6818596.1 Rrf2 family transcriptional regulator [Bacteroidota bacterium]MBK7041225.1 Rrf2 family transcriptional regulator [Bacteroidota bacterium]MBK7588608.1 Rrf2 family transcriptional regulator [Bacteroidota bacterium]MBK8328705.1 Rrf2 family transcriptional regulator [Bacteroidota bacterium]